MSDSSLQTHPIPPLWDGNSRILILGSFPSAKSREVGFFYGHPQNRFWRVTSAVFEKPCPITVPEKKEFLLSCGIALWDVIASCRVVGSSDSSIRDVKVNDLTAILEGNHIRKIFTNGATAGKLYEKYLFSQTGIPAVTLPSTSPANAAMSLEKLIEEWKIVKI